MPEDKPGKPLTENPVSAAFRSVLASVLLSHRNLDDSQLVGILYTIETLAKAIDCLPHMHNQLQGFAQHDPQLMARLARSPFGMDVRAREEDEADREAMRRLALAAWRKVGTSRQRLHIEEHPVQLGPAAADASKKESKDG